MKKQFLIAAAACMLACVLGGCASQAPSEQEGAPESAVDALSAVWAQYSDDESFAVVGGDYAAMVEGAPGSCDVSDAASLKSILVVPEQDAALIDDAASLVHAMNANTFTAGAFHLADAANADGFIGSYEDAVMGNQWMCGFPEKLVVANLGNGYIVTMFGNGDLVENFKGKLVACYPSADVAVEEVL